LGYAEVARDGTERMYLQEDRADAHDRMRAHRAQAESDIGAKEQPSTVLAQRVSLALTNLRNLRSRQVCLPE
jgi:hypothetical protein